jgi:hypothetical protein
VDRQALRAKGYGGMSDQTVDELRGHLSQVIHNLQPFIERGAQVKARVTHIPKRERKALLLMRNSIKQRCAC